MVNREMNHLMLDLETLGVGERPVITNIGAVVFNIQDGVVAEFSCNLDWAEQQAYGREIDASTVKWWLKQSNEAQIELTSSVDAISLWDALEKLSRFYEVNMCQAIWGNGALADIRWINTAYATSAYSKKFKQWQFYQEFCYRTMKAMHPKVDIPFEGTEHNALDDARHQAKVLIEILKGIGNDTH